MANFANKNLTLVNNDSEAAIITIQRDCCPEAKGYVDDRILSTLNLEGEEPGQVLWRYLKIAEIEPRLPEHLTADWQPARAGNLCGAEISRASWVFSDGEVAVTMENGTTVEVNEASEVLPEYEGKLYFELASDATWAVLIESDGPTDYRNTLFTERTNLLELMSELEEFLTTEELSGFEDYIEALLAQS